MKYTSHTAPRRRWPRRLITLAIIAVVFFVGATIAVRYVYDMNLKPVSSSQQSQTITVKEGYTADQIAALLQSKSLIRSAWAFKLYVSSKDVRGDLQAGTYEISPSQSIADIVSQLTHGKIVTNLVTILPGQSIDQIRMRLVQNGFKQSDVDSALDPANYTDNPALVDKPATASLEGYLYPNSYQRTTDTSATVIVNAALQQMNAQLTPDLRSAFAKQGLSTYQAIVMASIIEKEVSKQSDRDQVAQVFLARLRLGMHLQSDVTVKYGATLAGVTNWSGYPSVYNTYLNPGLPPTPISNVSASTLKSVAYPANTSWLYFVAGDDGNTHFAKTAAEHQTNIQQYCKTLCVQ